jgi:mRNA interferase MazF
VYWIDWSPARGSEQAGRRPGLIVSIDSFNRSMPVVEVAAVTTKIKSWSRIAVNLPAGDPLPEASQVLAFQVSTIDKSRLDGYVGVLSPAQLNQVRDSLRFLWGL